ncbi:MAG: cobalamin-independent methionine synthase II family protein [Chloroflexi bacterium]|nr:cobalamin-independent methionine synthase II family protein [Chloroflexota bacterium]MCI0781595.1 cobalamin-independent methionine synthase II family protein [Chloroflexota bacterium]MCI0786330.1 cobalamin-independent methionine synthase II family protein [Chloroflexota bacterium]MCI0798832.1 cobalamin-independent methionine synthase II family protein [Chloroflexota bacterium]MCI0824852.1 cobalamin-independent methionine synthase II family protein [Chloroflexota bacterium]
MKRSTERILTTHAGSLARPPDLLEMILAKETGQPYDPEVFAERVHTAVSEVVTKQIDSGVDVVSDGEQGKPGFANYVGDRLSGIVTREGARPRVWRDREEFPEFQPPEAGTVNTRRLACTGPLGWKDKAAVQVDIDNFREALRGVQHTEAFIPAVSPGTLAQNVINDYYEDERTFLFAVADVMKEEYQAIVEAGFLLQIDSPDLAMGLNVQYPDKTLEEYREIIGVRVEALNHALSGIPREQVRHHICWGNAEAPHHRDVELKGIIDVLLRVNAGAIYVEGANPRHGHEWKVFRDVELPDNMLVIAGVIDTKTNIIEHPELVADRIENYASVVGRENVIAGTDCGFGTSADRTRVVPSISWAKLKSMAEGARLATERLWG